jgi:P-type Mg2+ transporter
MESKNALYPEFSKKQFDYAIKKFNSDKNGISGKEASERLETYGRNEIRERKNSWYTILIRQFRSSFTYLLIAATILSFFLREYIDMAMILIFLSINVSLGFIEEFKSENAVQMLRKYISVRARVRRDNKELIISGEDIVPGDIVIIEAGDIIPADIRLIDQNNLIIDESPLTGESAPVQKSSETVKLKSVEPYQASNIGFSSTKVVGGKGEGIVVATGQSAMIGQIAKLTDETKRVSTFEKGLDKFSKFILYMVLITLAFIFIGNILIKEGRVNIFELTLFAIALAVSVIPEALPVVTSVSLSQGAMRLAKMKVVVRRLSAIEDLGSIEILCTDKTGTLTENKLTVSEINAKNKKSCLMLTALASSFLNDKKQESNNAFDIAIYDRISKQEEKSIDGHKRVSENPFTPTRKRNSVVVEKEGERTMIVRGAPEVILALCKNISIKQKQAYLNWIAGQGKLGRRNLAVAWKKMPTNTEHYSEAEESGLDIAGIISFEDPVKESTKHAIKEARKLGVELKILTGDSPEVSGSVAKQIGLIESDDLVITGEEIEAMNIHEQHRIVHEKTVFARVSPVQKYNIIKLLQERYEVGFLGEGINDAPALQAANVSIVVDSASDIAREASDIILLQQSLEVIVSGIQQGREIFSNTVKYIKSTLTSNFGNFYAIAAATLIIDYLPMLPLQILLLNLLSDFPMIAIATDNVDVEELKRPRNYEVKEIVLIASLLGIISTIFDFFMFSIFKKFSPEILHTNWFIGSILTELILIYSIRTRRPFFKAKPASKLLVWLTVFVSIITVILPYTRIGHRIFGFVSPRLFDLFIIFSIVITYFFVTESVKLKYYQYIGNKPRPYNTV